jgi:pyridoxal phosphate enzyme (YggS family)
MYDEIKQFAEDHQATLVAVSKTKSVDDIMVLYQKGQRIFGENRVQELTDKYELLPKDIDWHIIGHLQKNKVKYIAPFVSMIHSVDSFDLLEVINQQAKKHNRIIPVLLQFHIAQEETKFGLNIKEANKLLQDAEDQKLVNVKICGVMGMASFTDDQVKVRNEFRALKDYFDTLKNCYFPNDEAFKVISMGMSGDYKIAIAEGSNMIRVGSAIFGARQGH